MIPVNMLIKYQMGFDGETTEEVKERYGDEFYTVFLTQTDFIPNKILEGVATSADYADELYYREFARREINGDTENSSTQKPLDTRVGEIERPTNIMLGTESNMEQASEQFRKALQIFAHR